MMAAGGTTMEWILTSNEIFPIAGSITLLLVNNNNNIITVNATKIQHSTPLRAEIAKTTMNDNAQPPSMTASPVLPLGTVV
jgi:hypothetical protein